MVAVVHLEALVVEVAVWVAPVALAALAGIQAGSAAGARKVAAAWVAVEATRAMEDEVAPEACMGSVSRTAAEAAVAAVWMEGPTEAMASGRRKRLRVHRKCLSLLPSVGRLPKVA